MPGVRSTWHSLPYLARADAEGYHDIQEGEHGLVERFHQDCRGVLRVEANSNPCECGDDLFLDGLLEHLSKSTLDLTEDLR